MKTLKSHLVGVDQGDVVVFSDFKEDGPMWSGSGEREVRIPVRFSDRFASSPAVSAHISMLDLSAEANVRTDVQAETVTALGFEIVFRTWGDTRIARARVAWQAIGELPDTDAWVL